MSGNRFLGGKTAIAGLGATEFSKNSGRSEIQLGVEAIKMALDDAGIGIDEVDGMASYTMDNNPEIELFRLLGGKELKFFSRTHYGCGAGPAPPLPYARLASAPGPCPRGGCTVVGTPPCPPLVLGWVFARQTTSLATTPPQRG